MTSAHASSFGRSVAFRLLNALRFDFRKRRASIRRRETHRAWVQAKLRHEPSEHLHKAFVQATAQDLREGR